MAQIEPGKTLVACVGNMLLLDEGFGPYMARVLTENDAAAEHFDAEHVDELMRMFRPYETHAQDDGRIAVLDAGTMGMSMVPFIRDYDRIVIVDVVDMGEESGVAPGTVYVLTPEDMADHTIMHTLHDLRVVDVINNARLAGYDCDIRCVCASVRKEDIDPEDFCIDLTPPLKAAVPVAIGALLETLGLG